MSAPAETPWRILTQWREPVADAVTRAIESACDAGSPLRGPMTRLTDAVQVEGRMSNRLLPLAVLGALTNSPAPAVPVCAMSTLWWAGAEALDDLLDAPHGQDGPGLSRADLLIAGVACMELAPQVLVARLHLKESLRRAWLADLTGCSLAAAEAQLSDIADDPSELTWQRVMRTYVGKTGAAYARDVVMVARLASSSAAELRGWRAFGHLYGVLRQLRNDNSPGLPEDNEDLVNGTPTLLLAHALGTGSPARRDHLLELRAEARTDAGARVELHERLHEAAVVLGYLDRLAGLHGQACALVAQLTAPSVYQDVLRAAIDTAVALAAPPPAGGQSGTPDHRRLAAGTGLD